jgi:hypothetical protein
MKLSLARVEGNESNLQMKVKASLKGLINTYILANHL